MMNPMVLRLPSEVKEELENEAKRQRQSSAEIMRRALKNYLKTKPAQKDAVSVLLKWTKDNKKYPSQTKNKNLSTTYKKYLYPR